MVNDKTRTAHGESQREALIVACFNVIARNGFEGLRTREVAAEVGVNIATLHYYFPAKSDLVHAVAEHLLKKFQQPAEAPDRQSWTPHRILCDELEDALSSGSRRDATYTVHLELLLRAYRDPSVREVVQNIHREWEAYLTSVVDAGIRSGQFSPGRPSAEIARDLRLYFVGTTCDPLNEDAHGRSISARLWLENLVGLTAE